MTPTTLAMPPHFTGPIRIDALAGHAPTWRPDHGSAPIYGQLVAELGPPGRLVGPAVQTLPGELAAPGDVVRGRRAARAAEVVSPC